jgi:hypothetical protein
VEKNNDSIEIDDKMERTMSVEESIEKDIIDN